MNRSNKLMVKSMTGTGAMALISVTFIAGLALCVLNSLLPMNRLEVFGYIVHFAAVYLGSLICCGIAKEKKALCAGISIIAWYVLLLFVSVVLLDCDGSNIIGSMGVGLCGYGAALLTVILPKKRTSGRRVKFRSR